MTSNEIKKEFYKQKPIAHFQYINKGSVIYTAIVSDIEVKFDIPLTDIGTAEFLPEMDGKMLLRWLMVGEESL